MTKHFFNREFKEAEVDLGMAYPRIARYIGGGDCWFLEVYNIRLL
jgi:hypothetical protein